MQSAVGVRWAREDAREADRRSHDPDLGRHDLATPLPIAEAASARYGWPLHLIENAAEDPAIEQPEAFLQAPHSGANAEADLGAVRTLGDPIVDLVTERPYAAQQSMLDDMEPKGLHQYCKAEYLPGLSSGYVDTFRDEALKLTSPLSYSVIFHIGGAVNEHDDDDGAVGNRDARFISGFSGVWPPDDHADGHVAWVREAWERIRPFSTGGNYVNFQLADDDEGKNYERLQRVKAEHDPDNLFRVNRNIPPEA